MSTIKYILQYSGLHKLYQQYCFVWVWEWCMCHFWIMWERFLRTSANWLYCVLKDYKVAVRKTSIQITIIVWSWNIFAPLKKPNWWPHKGRGVEIGIWSALRWKRQVESGSSFPYLMSQLTWGKSMTGIRHDSCSNQHRS